MTVAETADLPSAPQSPQPEGQPPAAQGPTPAAADAINDALAKLWEAGQVKTFGRLEALETVVAALAVGDDTVDIDPGIVAAHKLAGTLGMFGLPGGSKLAREIEIALEAGGIDPDQALDLAAKAARLRTSIESKPADSAPIAAEKEALQPLLLVGRDRAYREALHLGAERFGFASSVTDRWTGDPGSPGQVVMVDLAPGGPDLGARQLVGADSETLVVAVGVGSSLEGRLLAASLGIDLMIPEDIPAEQALDIVAQELTRRQGGGTAIIVPAVSGGGAKSAARALGRLLPNWTISDAHSSDLFARASVDADMIAVLVGEDEIESARLICHALCADIETRRAQICVVIPQPVATADPVQLAEISRVVDQVLLFDHDDGWREIGYRFERALNRESRRHQDRFTSYRTLTTKGVLKQLRERLEHQAQSGSDPASDPDGSAEAMVVFTAAAALADSDETGANATTASEALNTRVDRAYARVFGRGDLVGQWRSGSVFALRGDRRRVEERLEVVESELRAAGIESCSGIAAAGVDGAEAESLLEFAYRRARAGDQMVSHERPNTVLVVEDDEIIATIVKDLVTSAGFDVVAVTDGLSAAEILCDPDVASNYGLVLLDVSLPGIDGFDVLGRMARANTAGEVPVMLLTARAGEREIMRGFELGAIDYVAKPFSPPVLLSRIEKAMAQ